MTSLPDTIVQAIPHVQLTEPAQLTPTASLEHVYVYGPEDCPGCAATIDFLDRKDMPAEKITVSPGDPHHRYITEDLQYLSAPVVTAYVSDTDPVTGAERNTVFHWSGLNNFLLRALSRISY